jgi:acyl-CoA reductase-like NAD-dependent aldehyde dehydrogenase
MYFASIPMTSFDPTLGQIFVANDYVVAPGAPLTEVKNPADLSTVGRIAQCAPASLDAVLSQAKAAQKDWATLDGKSRAAALHKLADAMAAATAGPAAELMTLRDGQAVHGIGGRAYECRADLPLFRGTRPRRWRLHGGTHRAGVDAICALVPLRRHRPYRAL